jgi:hypothetical protein
VGTTPPPIHVPINIPIIASIKIACITLPIESMIPFSISSQVKPKPKTAISAPAAAPTKIGMCGSAPNTMMAYANTPTITITGISEIPIVASFFSLGTLLITSLHFVCTIFRTHNC